MQELTNIMFSSLAMGLLWWLWFIEYRRMRIDITRQKLFALRDDLFNWVSENDPSLFDNEVYIGLRDTCNGMIRFAHRFSFFRVIWILYIHIGIMDGVPAREYQEYYINALRQLSPDTRKEFEKVHLEMHVAMLRHIVFTSFILSLAYTFMRLIRQAQKAAKIVLQSKPFRRRWFALDIEAQTVWIDKSYIC